MLALASSTSFPPTPFRPHRHPPPSRPPRRPTSTACLLFVTVDPDASPTPAAFPLPAPWAPLLLLLLPPLSCAQAHGRARTRAPWPPGPRLLLPARGPARRPLPLSAVTALRPRPGARSLEPTGRPRAAPATAVLGAPPHQLAGPPPTRRAASAPS
nr:vegetative cell wall protein gp1-like [Aegilops tauschii subsp. strangulata]